MVISPRQVNDITQSVESLKINLNETQENFSNKLEILSNKIDETLSDSINILRNDYEKKVTDVQTHLVQSQCENNTYREESQQRMENLLMEKIGQVNNNLMDQMSKIYHSSVSREDEIMKKIEEMENNVKNLNENFEAMTTQLEDVQEKLYDFEQNKKNNLIFYGVPGDGRESKDDLKLKILNLLKLRLNIRREIPVVRASRMLTGLTSSLSSLVISQLRSESSRLSSSSGDVRDVQGQRRRVEELQSSGSVSGDRH